ncbi:MAG: Ion transport 2 domain protein [Candidatus Peribacteria bacterium]|nr:Ion transport 2 domain protein [Candidatus Peribacteria bacterium]
MERITRASYPMLFLVWALIIVTCAGLYFGLSFIPGKHSLTGFENMEPMLRAVNSIYFSIITATTVGYGDLAPHSYAKIVVSLQSVTTFFIAAIFVAKLVSHRQEITLERVHKLTFEDVFHNTREGFFIIRKDLSIAMHEIEKNGAISAHQAENLIIAYRQMQNLLEEIPEFYGDDAHLYTIDGKRELLLLDAVQRTTGRLLALLQMCKAKNVTWKCNHASTQELEELLQGIEFLLPIWKEKSPHQEDLLFGVIVETTKELREMTA